MTLVVAAAAVAVAVAQLIDLGASKGFFVGVVPTGAQFSE